MNKLTIKRLGALTGALIIFTSVSFSQLEGIDFLKAGSVDGIKITEAYLTPWANAFGAGIMISFLELACTGQVYLPTIIFVSSIPGMRLQAFLYLLLYNLMFILPLVIIFVLVYFGTTSKDLTRFLHDKAAAVKFAMSIVFIALGSWLIVSIIL